MAKNQTLEKKIISSAPGVFAAVYQHLYLLESFLINKWLMSPFYNDPIFWCPLNTFFGFITDLHHSTLHHISDISLIFQHFRNSFAAPQTRIGSRISYFPSTISCWRRNLFIIQRSRDFSATHTRKCHHKNPAYYRCYLFIHNDLVLFRWVHFIPIHGFPANELTLSLFISLDRLDFFGNILCVHIVHDCPKRGNIICGRIHPGINTIQ